MASTLRKWLLLGLVLFPFAAPAADISMMTENYPPFSYREGNEIKGVSVELMDALMTRAGVPYKLDLLPWARAYTLAQTMPDHCVFATVHTAERDAKFKWVEPIAISKTFLVRKTGSTARAETIEQARNFVVGTQRGDFTEELLRKNMFSRVDLTSDIELTLRKLMLGRIDLMPMSEGYYSTLKRQGRTLEKVVELDRSIYAIACNKAMADETIASMQKGLDAVLSDGTLRKIHERYGIADVVD